MAWVKWDSILLSYGAGGLNIGSLKAKNLALLGKWWWRFRTETDAYWVKIIKSIYGRDGGLGYTSGSRVGNGGFGYSPWKDVIKIGKDMDKCDISFNNSLVRFIGENRDILFRDDTWVGEQCSKSKFPRLYKLDENQNAQVIDRVVWSRSGAIFDWQWCREPRGRNIDDLQELIRLINGVPRADSGRDEWKWVLSGDGKYNTKNLADKLDDNLYGSNSYDSETDRNRLLPQSIGIFVWRAKRRRLQVRIELDNRGIDLHSVRCPLCDEDIESLDHALVLCKHSHEVWENIYRWWGVAPFTSTCVADLLNGTGHNIRGHLGKSLWQAVEWVTGYLLWKNRNHKVYHNTSRSTATLVNDIQVKSFEWISKRAKKYNLQWHQCVFFPEDAVEISKIENGLQHR
ncbi:uncharacterized protein [Rutidosis leptorrhynchoides]|uniref:uncharacterized protein n=1 Tax=Rutidosis leptorrhynchoides TaxID=125765 RepID=UPI003A996EE0